MKLTKVVHQTEINVLYTVHLQLFFQIKVPFIKFKKYLEQNYKTNWVIAGISEKFLKIPARNFNLK